MMEADGPDDADHLWEPVPPGVRAPPEGEDDNGDDDGPADLVGDENRNEDGSWEGGIAEGPGQEGQSRRRSADADLVLFLECSEMIDIAPDHPILQPGVAVSIGLEKSTKLSEVFRRYCTFCNEKAPPSSHIIQRSDLEFFHCALLNEHDTAEASALMKSDRIQVRKVRADERKAEMELKRFQRESDREYFRKLRQLLPDAVGTKSCDVLFDCQGKLVDEHGLNQKLLRTYVQGHSAILAKRCPWLGRIIQTVRDENERRSVITIPENEGSGAAGSEEESTLDADNSREVVAEPISPKPQNDDDGIEALQYPIDQRPLEPAARVVNDEDTNESSVAKIENSEDDDNSLSSPHPRAPDCENRDSAVPIISSTTGSSNMLWVTLSDHPPEAVKLLLEYCYTNRVLALGHDAFVESSRANPLSSSLNGNVMPFLGTARRWPNNGLPLVSFSVALSGLSLAEEASMSRLALMCEVAAAQLVTRSNFVEALSLCSTQQLLTGNGLPRLREAAMEVLFRHGERGVVDVCRMPTFRKALLERSSVVVPSLLIGTRDAVAPKAQTTPHLSGSKRHWSYESSTRRCFEQMDKDDSYRREMERRKRRKERRKERGEENDEDDDELMMDAYSPACTKKSLKRMYPQALLGRRGLSRSGSSKVSSRRRSSGRKRNA